jgi:two-component SAPR family response regulator
MDMDSTGNVLTLGEKLIDIDKGSKFLYIANDINKAYEATTIFADYFLPKPIPIEGLKKILSKVLKSIRSNSLVI